MDNIIRGLLLAAIIIGFAWMGARVYKKRNEIRVPFVVRFEKPYRTIDLSKNRQLGEYGRWTRIGNGTWRISCRISEEELRRLVEEQYPDIPSKDILVWNSLNGYGASI